MTNPKKFFLENVDMLASIEQQSPIESNEHKGFLAMSEAIEHIQLQLNQLSHEVAALRQELQTDLPPAIFGDALKK